MAERPNLPKADAETQRLSAQLAEEVATWPSVRTRPMFGLLALYRGTRIFAALPRARAAGTSHSLLIKLPVERDRRLTAASSPGADWSVLALESSADLSAALRVLERAYDRARHNPSAAKRPRHRRG